MVLSAVPVDKDGFVEALRLTGLSLREAEVVFWVARGLEDKEIAAQMRVTAGTIRAYEARCRAKLGAKNRAELVARAYDALLEERGGGAGESMRMPDSRHASTAKMATFWRGIFACKMDRGEKAMYGKRQSLTAVLSLAGGTLAAWFVVPSLSSAGQADPFAGVQHRIENWWVPDLVGQRINLPARDSQGYATPKNKSFVVVALSCSTCSSVEQWAVSLRAARLQPIAIVVDHVTARMAKLFGGDPERFLLLEYDAANGTVPEAMIRFAPQAAVVGPDGRIARTPENSQSMVEFVTSSGGNR